MNSVSTDRRKEKYIEKLYFEIQAVSLDSIYYHYSKTFKIWTLLAFGNLPVGHYLHFQHLSYVLCAWDIFTERRESLHDLDPQ
jgi:hypothetical protein